MSTFSSLGGPRPAMLGWTQVTPWTDLSHWTKWSAHRLFFNKQPINEQTLCATNISSWSDSLESRRNVSQLGWKLIKVIFPAPTPPFLKSRMWLRLLNWDILPCSTNGLSLTAYTLHRKKIFLRWKDCPGYCWKSSLTIQGNFKASHGGDFFINQKEIDQ